MTVKERIKTVLERHNNYSINKLANGDGKTQRRLQRQINESSKVTEDTTELILTVFPDVSPKWLLMGEGEMLKPESTQKDDDERSNYCLVPLINIDSVGGIHSQNELDASEQYVIRNVPFSEARQGDVAIIQTGHSMSPTIPPGSILLLRQVEDWREYFGYGNVFVLWLKDNRRITKQVLKYGPDPKNYITCHSYNPEAEDEELPKSFIRGVWKVIKYQVDFGW